MKHNPFAWLRKKPKSHFNQIPQTLAMEIKPMSAEILGQPINRAVQSYKNLQAAHANAAKMILELDAKIAADAELIASYKAILDEVFPEDMGGSMGGVVG